MKSQAEEATPQTKATARKTAGSSGCGRQSLMNSIRPRWNRKEAAGEGRAKGKRAC